MSFSRFRLADLQVHTTADKQHKYGQWHGNDRGFAEKLARSLLDAGVTVVALTDHLSVDMWPVVSEVAEPMGVAVFPGIEASANGCHLIAIFERSEQGHRNAQHFLLQQLPVGAGPLDDKGGSRTLDVVAVDFANAAVEAGALVIAPHSTQDKMGLFGKQVVRTKETLVQSGYVSAYDMQGSAGHQVLRAPQEFFGDRQPTWILTGDMRSFESAGERAVHLKLDGEPTLEGLRQAFLMPDQRVRIPERHRDRWSAAKGAVFADVEAPDWPRIESLRVEGGFLDGLDVELGPGLNAVIGGKGTGKSAVIEAVRFALGQPDPSDKQLVGNRKRNVTASTDVSVGVVTGDGTRYTAKRAGTDPKPELMRGDQASGVDVDRRFSVRVFGQHELQHLADSDPLRDFLAAEAAGDWDAALDAERESLARLASLSERMGALEEDADRLEQCNAELADINERLDRAREGGADSLLSELQTLTRDDRLVQAAARWPATVRSAADDLRATLPRPEVPGGDPIADEVASELEDLAAKVSAHAGELEDAAVAAAASTGEITGRWAAKVQADRSRIESSLQEIGVSDAASLSADQTRAATLEAEVQSLEGADQSLEQLETERGTELGLLRSARRRQSRLIVAAARALNSRLGQRVRVEVEEMADRRPLVDAIKAVAAGAQGPALERAVRERTPADVVAAARDGAAAMESLGLTERAVAGLAGASPEELRRIEEVSTPDVVYLTMNVADDESPVWRQVAECSPGQRATAVLTLALVGGNDPLIIDQPEDDLDNRFIYDTVVKAVCEVCEQRQVIVATHNANLPVLGDAECVVALAADNDNATVVAHGGLEDPEVSRLARDILEGGDRAFKARQDRYSANT